MRTAVITGVNGFLGRFVAERLRRDEWDVVGVDVSALENAPYHCLSAYRSVVLPNDSIFSLFQEIKPDLCVHCAGRASVASSIDQPGADFESNTIVTHSLLDQIRQTAPACRFVFFSSAAVYGNPQALPVSENMAANPISPYGFHKLQSEIACREFARVYGMKTCAMRIFSAYGAGLRRQVVWDVFRKSQLNTEVELTGTGRESRDFVHAKDVACAVAIIAEKAAFEGEVYNVASGVEVQISEVANAILRHSDSVGSFRFDGATPVGTPMNWCADISKIKSLGFSPAVEFDDGLAEFVTWAKTISGSV